MPKQKPNKSRYPEVLADIEAHITAEAVAKGLDLEFAQYLGKSTAAILRKNYAGQPIYFPVCTSFDNAQRDAAIFAKFKDGDTMPEIASDEKLSVERIRQIINEQRALAQPQLF